MEKRVEFLRMFDSAAARARQWEKQNSGSGFLSKVGKVIRMPGFYSSHLLARFGWTFRNAEAKTFWGYSVRLPGSGSDAIRLSLFGTLGYENEDKVTRFLIRQLRPSDVFYDIGASYGFYTYLALEFISEGEIHAFEPLPEAFFFLRQNVRNSPRRFLNNCVLSDREGSVSFYQGYPSTVSSTMVQEVSRMNRWNRYKKMSVPSMTLDSYMQDHTPPTIMKIDAEGAETLIIKGGRKFFSQNNPTIIMEIWDGEKGKQFSLPAAQELFSLGYAPYEILQDGTLKKKEQSDILSFTGDSFDNVVFRK